MRLVGDIGGTNTRLALCQNGHVLPRSVQSFENDRWPHLYEIIGTFLQDAQHAIADIVLAVAGPIAGNRATLTNRRWAIDRAELVETFGCADAQLINDLSALGYAAQTLGAEQTEVLYDGGAGPAERGQSLIVGIGTGFNVSPVITTPLGSQCLSAEMGHVALPAPIAAKLQTALGPAQPFATVEDLFSGRGFEKFCRCLTSKPTLSGREAIAAYGHDPELAQAVDHYSDLLGQLLRELSLAYMPTLGLYLAGSVGRAVLRSAPAPCIKTYCAPFNVTGTRPANLHVIQDDFAALQGCAALTSQALV